MITATGRCIPFQTEFTNGTILSCADAATDKGGGGEGFRPHELLEAALASCLNMTIRMCAVQHSIPLTSVNTVVRLDRSAPEEVLFEYEISFAETMAEADRNLLMDAVRSCPVRNTLSKSIRFREA